VRILVTGASGFIGKNLIAELKNQGYSDIMECNRTTEKSKLDEYTQRCEFVFHLAGVNRPKEDQEFMEGNYESTSLLLESLNKNDNKSPVLITSSIQAQLDNHYGISKKAAEDLLLAHRNETGSKALIYRLHNVFGKWCRPNYNSVVATFCHNIAHDLQFTVNDSSVVMNLVYIDDVVAELINALNDKEYAIGDYCEVPIIHTISLGEIVKLINSFKNSREVRSIPNLSDGFTKKLYSTYLSYLPEDKFSYDLIMNVDRRGSFTEFIKTPDRGQVSVNISKPGIIKGNHWHHTKNEKFLVVSGKGVIRFRKINSDEIIEYYVSGEKMEAVDIPTGYTHNIENLGDMDMVTVMWANEPFDPEKPDTYFLEV
jgi:UDP-2-acetamido-2,6-beta-L-arabino-hexul-4-ose reductase